MKVFCNQADEAKYQRYMAEQRAITAANHLLDEVGDTATYEQMTATCAEYGGGVDVADAWGIYLSISNREQ